MQESRAEMGGQQVVVILVDGQIIEALAGRSWKLELNNLPQRRMVCCRLGAATT